MKEKKQVEVFSVKMDSACAALLDIALNSYDRDDRKLAIRRLSELGCNVALSIVAKKSYDRDDRKLAIKLIENK